MNLNAYLRKYKSTFFGEIATTIWIFCGKKTICGSPAVLYVRPHLNLTNYGALEHQDWYIFQFEWNAQFWFFRRKSFVSEIVNLSFANYSTTTDKSCLLENNYELPIEYIIDIVLKLMSFFAVRRRMESFWSTGVISLGEIIKTSFMAFLLPVEGNFTCCRAGGEFIPICSSSDPCGGETSGPHTFL